MHQIPWKRAALTLASLLAAGVLLWGWSRWNGTVDPEDPNQIVAAAVQQYGGGRSRGDAGPDGPAAGGLLRRAAQQ